MQHLSLGDTYKERIYEQTTSAFPLSPVGVSHPSADCNGPQIVFIPDPNLRTVIEKALSKASGAPITASDMAQLTHLEARNANITDLTGLEHATSLTELDLGGEWVDGEGFQSNDISDLVPLSGLMELTRLELRGNNISDISPVAGLTNLKRLSFEENKVSDISPSSGFN